MLISSVINLVISVAVAYIIPSQKINNMRKEISIRDSEIQNNEKQIQKLESELTILADTISELTIQVNNIDKINNSGVIMGDGNQIRGSFNNNK